MGKILRRLRDRWLMHRLYRSYGNRGLDLWGKTLSRRGTKVYLHTRAHRARWGDIRARCIDGGSTCQQ